MKTNKNKKSNPIQKVYYNLNKIINHPIIFLINNSFNNMKV